jgi:hypothetical protein
MSPIARNLFVSDRWAARRRSMWNLIYRAWWVPVAVLMLAILHRYS